MPALLPAFHRLTVTVSCFCLSAIGTATAFAKGSESSLNSTTPGVDSDRWLTPDPVIGGADRIEGNEAEPNMVAFTFDDGPDKNTTPAVLDALKEYDVPATFFVVTRRIVGKLGEEPREILSRTMREGHLIGSHSVTHRHLGKAGEALLQKEIDGSLKWLVRVSERNIGMFRPPFGALSKEGSAWLKKRGITNVLWSIDTLDWQAKSAPKLRAKVVKMILADKGGVVLMHDVKPITAEVIAGILDDLEASNCEKLAAGEEPIIPVSLHYFLKVGKNQREIPKSVLERTAAYRAALPRRCASRPVNAKRPTAPAPPPPPATVSPAVRATPLAQPLNEKPKSPVIPVKPPQ